MKKYTSFAVLFVALLSGCTKTEIQEVPADQGNTLQIRFDNQYGDQDFELKRRYAHQATDQSAEANLEIAFDRLRYWVSNIKLISSAGEEVAIPDAYYLIEETGEVVVQHLTTANIYPATKRDELIIRNVPTGNYTGVKFSIGVDSKYNDNITLTAGELGLLKGMGFSDGWMWFTSYIFQKLDAQMYVGNEEKSLRWDSGSNALFQGAEKTVKFPNMVTLDQTKGLNVDFKVDVQQLLSTAANPWVDNMISQSRPEMMVQFRDALLQKAIVLAEVKNGTAN